MAAWKSNTLGVMEENNSGFRNIIMSKNEHAEYVQFQDFKQSLLTQPT